MSVMVTSTSFIMLAGVDAPAVMPILRLPATGSAKSSSAVSMRNVSQDAAHTSRSFAVFELCRPPTTSIRSLCAESALASC